jgi:hypothetical protein
MNTPTMNRQLLNQYMHERLTALRASIANLPCVASAEELRTMREGPLEFNTIELNFTLQGETMWTHLEVCPYRVEPAEDFGTPMTNEQWDAANTAAFGEELATAPYSALCAVLRNEGRARVWTTRAKQVSMAAGRTVEVQLSGYLVVDASELEGPLWEGKTGEYGIPFKFRY